MAHPIAAKAATISEWYALQYKRAVGLAGLEGGEQFRRLTAAFPVASGDPSVAFPLSSRQRVMSTFMHLNMRYPLSRNGYAWLALTVADASEGKSGAFPVIYALAFWRRAEPGGAEPPGEGGGEPFRSWEDSDPEYISVAPTFESRDGEYRPRFLCYADFAAACRQWTSALAPFEEQALELAAKGALQVDARAHERRLLARAEELRLAPLCLAVALALDLDLAARGTLPPHTSVPYQRLLKAVGDARPALAAESARVHLEHPDLWASFSRGRMDSMALHAGVKLVPMSLKDTTNVLDATFAAWRELAAAQAATDLVINFVTPGAPLHGGWEYVEGAGAGPYENVAMAERFARSAAAADAVAGLRGARRRVAAIRPPTYHASALSARLLKDIEYAQGFLLMSQVAMLHVLENVGWTLAAHGALVRRMPAEALLLDYAAFASEDHAARLLFGLAFTAHCLHSKLGVAHTDLHCNNITYHLWGITRRPRLGPRGGEAYYADPLVAFVAGPRGEADTFLFPAAGDGCTIIDFSRCILGPAFRPRLEAGSPGNSAAFYRNQTNRALRALARYAPDYVKTHQAQLRAALLANFDAAFAVLCLVDFVALGANVGSALRAMAAEETKGDLRRFQVAPRALALAAELERAAREAFTLGLGELVSRAGPADGAQEGAAPGWRGPEARAPAGKRARVEAPGLSLLRRVFGDWQFARWAAREPGRLARAQLVDAFNANNELKASCRAYEHFPSWARLETISKHLGPYKLTELFERGPAAFLGSLGLGPRVAVVAAEARAEQEKLDGPPMPTSSWLED